MFQNLLRFIFLKDFVAKSRNILYIIEPNTYIRIPKASLHYSHRVQSKSWNNGTHGYQFYKLKCVHMHL